MANGRRHHYVPRFYLRTFGGSPKQVDLLNFASHRIVRGGSIAGQCYRSHFYGEDGELERAFSELEDGLAPIFRRVHEQARLPAWGSPRWAELVMFVAMQRERTEAAAALTEETFEEGIREILGEDGRFDSEMLSRLRLEMTNAVQISLASARDTAIGWSDLRPLLLTAPQPAFVTSDHPVALYNTYAERVTWDGVVGALCTGLQVIYPLTPTRCLVLYDPKVYAVRPKQDTMPADERDVRQINKLMASQARANIYFGPWFSDADAWNLARAVTRARTTPGVKFSKADEVSPQPRPDGLRRVLVYFYFTTPKVDLRLTMMRVRKRARRTPLRHRGDEYRRFRRPSGVGPSPPIEPGVFKVRRR